MDIQHVQFSRPLFFENMLEVGIYQIYPFPVIVSSPTKQVMMLGGHYWEGGQPGNPSQEYVPENMVKRWQDAKRPID